ncbi:unnamed protein product, partial [Iphiclides podalirius]
MDGLRMPTRALASIAQRLAAPVTQRQTVRLFVCKAGVMPVPRRHRTVLSRLSIRPSDSALGPLLYDAPNASGRDPLRETIDTDTVCGNPHKFRVVPTLIP